MPDITAQTGPIAVTITYVLIYYATQINLLRVKARLEGEYKARGEKFDRYFGQDRQLLAADRMQLNMLEHMPPFLVLLWLNAVYVSSFGATVAGGIYVASRVVYPVMIGAKLGRNMSPNIMLATGPGYGVLIYFAGALIWKLAGN